jgi:DNA ligase-1
MREFVTACDAVAKTTKKTEKVVLISELLKNLSMSDAAIAAIFLTGRPFPKTDERTLGVAGSILSDVLLELSGQTVKDLSASYRQFGDIGNVAQHVLLTVTPTDADLTLQQAASLFNQLAATRTSADKKSLLRETLKSASPTDVKYIFKIITSDLRMGFKENFVEEAIAKAFDQPIDAVRRANMLLGDIGQTLTHAQENSLAEITAKLFRPIGCMLATPVEDPAELFDDQKKTMYVEEKYDGIRAQIHKNSNGVKLYSRTLDEITEFFELPSQLAKLPGELILDGEVLAWGDSGPLPFTELQQRLGRKQMNLWLKEDIPIRFLAFDILLQDGALLLDVPLHERRQRLESVISATKAQLIELAPFSVCKSAEEVKSAFRASLSAGHEGIVAKDPASPYTPGRRGGHWFKLKEPLATLDVVVTAVELGHGKRHGVLSDYTFAIQHEGKFLNVGKAYSGLTDAEIATYTKFFQEHTLEDQGFRRIVEPTVVIEVAFNNIQRSNRHESGYALRFPRIVRLRPDKPISEIDTLERVATLFSQQFKKKTA